jgi:ribosome-associated protein
MAAGKRDDGQGGKAGSTGQRTEEPLARRLAKLLDECEVETFRASGPGGQHRNRRFSGVRLRHLPTGIVVTATERRSQHQNRAVALERLAARLKARRKRRKPRVPTRPSAASRRRRLDDKRHRGRVKAGRKPAGDAE